VARPSHDVFANRLANICNSVIVIKLGQGLSIFKHLHIVQHGCSIATETKLPGKPGDDVFSAIVLDKVAGCCIKWASFLHHSSQRDGSDGLKR
jgi:hypothetical protein